MVSLVPLETAEIAQWLAATEADYIRQRIDAGEDRETAERTTAEDHETFFPDGRPSPGQHIFRILDEGVAVGTLWIGELPDGPQDAWWVWSIGIDASARGRGFGREAMLLAESVAREHGARRLGLNVFGHNLVARSLYESLGYEVRSARMSKRL